MVQLHFLELEVFLKLSFSISSRLYEANFIQIRELEIITWHLASEFWFTGEELFLEAIIEMKHFLKLLTIFLSKSY